MNELFITLKICCILFGMASWIACVGVWVELPLLVNVMPEVRSNRGLIDVIFLFRVGRWHQKCL